MGVRNVRNLEIWKLGKHIALHIYKITEMFPPREIYGLASQMRRSSVSIPSNIAEGFNRFHRKVFERFLHISLGSCSELETQLEISHDLGFLTSPDLEKILDMLGRGQRMIKGIFR